MNSVPFTNYLPYIQHPHLLPSSSGPSNVVRFTLSPVLCPDRVKEVFEKPLMITDLNGKIVAVVSIKQFLFQLSAELTSIGVIPKHFDAVGGGVAYMFGSKKAAEYAYVKNIPNPNLEEFDRLKDLDLSIDLTGYDDQRLYEMAFCIVRALQRCGLPGSEYDLFHSVLFRKKVKCTDQGIAIVSLGNPDTFWLDLTFLTRYSRRHFSTRDCLFAELRGYLASKQPEMELVFRGAPIDGDSRDHPFLAIDHLLRKVLEIPNIKTVNHLGFLLLALFLSKNYTPVDQNYYKELAETFVSYHLITGVSYLDTLHKFKKNHLGNDTDLYAKVAAFVFRVLAANPDSKLTDWLKADEFVGNTPECRFLNFAKGKSFEQYQLSQSDLLCLAEVLGVTPSLAPTEEAWRSFLATFDAHTFDRQQLFGSMNSFPLYVAKRIQANQWNLTPMITTEQCLDLLENRPHLEDEPDFIAIKFRCERKLSQGKALKTWKKHCTLLPKELQKEWLTTLYDSPCEAVLPYLPQIFQEDIDKKAWLKKLFDARFFKEAVSIALASKNLDMYKYTVGKLFKSYQIGECYRFLQQIEKMAPELYVELNQYSQAQSVLLIGFLSDQATFNTRIKNHLACNNYKGAETLLKESDPSYELEPNLIEKIVEPGCLEALKNNDFERLEFLINQALQHHMNQEAIVTLLNRILVDVQKEGPDSPKVIWCLSYFIHGKISSLCNAGQLVQLGLDRQADIPLANINNWLLFALNAFCADQSAEKAMLVHACVRTLKVNRKSLRGSLIKLSDYASR